ncbi:MAG: phosphotransferase [Anaerolineaceae bacterium]|nr:phosphotransferase [Anaerolineaceae bacterium]
MDPNIKKLYTPDILQEVVKRFGIKTINLELLDGFESYIYSFRKDGQSYILRIGHNMHRDPDAVQGEAEFIEYLAKNGIRVGRPVRELSGSLIEIVPAQEGDFSAVVFEKVPGNPPNGMDWEGTALMEKLGHLVGQMHSLTKDFEPSLPRFRRLNWEEDIDYVKRMITDTVSGKDREIYTIYENLTTQARQLPMGRDDYGLIHFDVHSGNFFVHDGEIWLFDFDDCLYDWFADDIAMVFFYASPHHCDSAEQIETTHKRFEAFFRAYSQENSINPDWLPLIPVFLTLREIDLYARILKDIPEEEYDGWCRSYMSDRRERILTRHPFVPLDFSTLLD